MNIPGLTPEMLAEMRENYAQLTRKERYGIVREIATYFNVRPGYMRKLLVGMRDLKDRRRKENR